MTKENFFVKPFKDSLLLYDHQHLLAVLKKDSKNSYIAHNLSLHHSLLPNSIPFINDSAFSNYLNLTLTLINKTNFFFYYIAHKGNASIPGASDDPGNKDFYDQNRQIIFPGKSVNIRFYEGDPYYGFVTFDAYFNYNGNSIGSYAGQFQIIFGNDSPVNIYFQYLNGSAFNSQSSFCGNPGTCTETSTLADCGSNPFFTISETFYYYGTATAEINVYPSSFNLLYSASFSSNFVDKSDYTNNQYEIVPDKVATKLKLQPQLTIDNNIVKDSKGNVVVLNGVSFTGTEYTAAPNVFDFVNDNSLNALSKIGKGKVNTVRIPLNTFFFIQEGETNPCIDAYTTSIKNKDGSSIIASSSQLILLDNIINSAISNGIPFIVLDLHSTSPISDLLDAPSQNGWKGQYPGSTGAYGSYSAQSPMASQTALSFWTLLATKYKGYKNIIFELFNEPQLIKDLNELNYWFYSSETEIPLSQNAAKDSSKLSRTVNQTVAGFKDLITTVRDITQENIIIVSGNAFNANFAFLNSTQYADWKTFLTQQKQTCIGYHAYGQGDGTPEYIGVPTATDPSKPDVLNALVNYKPEFDVSKPENYAPFGKTDAVGNLSVTADLTEKVGWHQAFEFLLDTFPLLSTESGLNFNTAVKYGGDYLRYYLAFKNSKNKGNFHIMPWAWTAHTLCTPSLLKKPYSINSSCEDSGSFTTENLLGPIDPSNPEGTTTDCSATSSLETANGTFPGYGQYWVTNVLSS